MPGLSCSCLRLHTDEPDGCGNCRFFACFGCTYPGPGECRKRAPVGNSPGDVAVWPRVRRSDWCGDYERRAAENQA